MLFVVACSNLVGKTCYPRLHLVDFRDGISGWKAKSSELFTSCHPSFFLTVPNMIDGRESWQ